MSKLKKLFTNWRVLVLIGFLLLSFIAINPQPWNEGAAIRSVAKGSAAELAGIQPPSPHTPPTARERVLKVNNQPVRNAADYYRLAAEVMQRGVNQTFTITTNKNLYQLTTRPAYKIVTLNETEVVNVTKYLYNETTNTTTNVTVQEVRNKTKKVFVGVEDIGLRVFDAPKTNIKKGLDLSGGTRVILKPREAVSVTDMDLIVENIKERLNVFGLSDLVVRTAKDLQDQDYIVVEIAGVNAEEVRSLISEQGKFEAKIQNKTVFFGGDKDITYVCRSADCSGIDPRGCGQLPDGTWSCRFRFSISLSPAAAARQAAMTKNLDVVVQNGQSYLSAPIDLFLDDVKVDSLQIGADLKGRALTNIEISGPGTGKTEQEAVQNALLAMKKLQTVMITGSLPVKLDIVKTDSISPVLGQEFVNNALIVGLFAILAVILVVFLRYHKLQVSIPMSITMLSEAFIILGFAAVAGWNLDLAAIAAIIISVGTGVDDQIVIADEILAKGEQDVASSWRERIKRALFIILASYVTTAAAMIPLMSAGAGMLRGFAITTIVGVSIGVFITRQAFAAIVEILVKEE